MPNSRVKSLRSKIYLVTKEDLELAFSLPVEETYTTEVAYKYKYI